MSLKMGKSNLSMEGCDCRCDCHVWIPEVNMLIVSTPLHGYTMSRDCLRDVPGHVPTAYAPCASERSGTSLTEWDHSNQPVKTQPLERHGTTVHRRSIAEVGKRRPESSTEVLLQVSLAHHHLSQHLARQLEQLLTWSSYHWTSQMANIIWWYPYVSIMPSPTAVEIYMR